MFLLICKNYCLIQSCKIQSLRCLRQVAYKDTRSVITGWGRKLAALHALSQKAHHVGLLNSRCFLVLAMNLQFKSVKNNFACSLFRGFNEVLNGLADDGWSVIESDGIDDVCISVNSSKVTGCNATFSSGLTIVSTGVLCAKASMLLQVSFTMKLELIFFLFGWSCPVFFIQYFCCLLGCLSSITTAIFARTPVTMGWRWNQTSAIYPCLVLEDSVVRSYFL